MESSKPVDCVQGVDSLPHMDLVDGELKSDMTLEIGSPLRGIFFLFLYMEKEIKYNASWKMKNHMEAVGQEHGQGIAENKIGHG